TGTSPTEVAEAERVASAAVIAFPPHSENGGAPDLHVKIRKTLEIADVSIVVPVQHDVRRTERFLASLDETLPQAFRGEIVLVDDALDDPAAALLDRFAQTHERAVVVRNPTALGPLASASRGADAAGEDALVFVGSEALLLPDWLRPLLDTQREHADAGAVGGRIVDPGGGLREAGGTVFRDGSALHFGYGQANPEAGLFDYVRRVDYCSRLLLATPRRLFLELGGFDRSFGPDV